MTSFKFVVCSYLVIIWVKYVFGEITSLPYTEIWDDISNLDDYSIMNEVNLSISNDDYLTARLFTETVWWKEQMNALYIYNNISLNDYPSFAFTTIVKARSAINIDNPIQSGYHYGGPVCG